MMCTCQLPILLLITRECKSILLILLGLPNALERLQMNFATVTGCQAIMTSIVPKTVDGDLLKLVHPLALETLRNDLNNLKIKKIDIQQLTEQFTVEQVKEMLRDIITSCLGRRNKRLKGISSSSEGLRPFIFLVPTCHSTRVSSGLESHHSVHISPRKSTHFISKPFVVTKEYAQIIYDQTSSPRLDKVLTNWD
ncbi:unnamed protein product [Rhizoctonia solani]|nr:unnamed protein product [Rhizoctonia solani]